MHCFVLCATPMNKLQLRSGQNNYEEFICAHCYVGVVLNVKLEFKIKCFYDKCISMECTIIICDQAQSFSTFMLRRNYFQ